MAPADAIGLRVHQSPWLAIRHVPHEHLGTLSAVLEQAGMTYQYRDVFRGDSVPQELSGLRGLIVMGGPMGVYEGDRYPFLRSEQDLIRKAADSGVPVLGICLGAQLVAAALGARVYPGPRKEIGWYEVERVETSDPVMSTLPASFMAFHWHGDTFDLPEGATRLARSALYENQAFRWGRNVYALQFHFEVNAAMVSEWLADPGCQTELASVSATAADAVRQQAAQWAESLETLSAPVLRRFLGLVS
jgi:GMP synthase (glutamine-hydrolysing)